MSFYLRKISIFRDEVIHHGLEALDVESGIGHMLHLCWVGVSSGGLVLEMIQSIFDICCSK
jgi:hypothetical protein